MAYLMAVLVVVVRVELSPVRPPDVPHGGGGGGASAYPHAPPHQVTQDDHQLGGAAASKVGPFSWVCKLNYTQLAHAAGG